MEQAYGGAKESNLYLEQANLYNLRQQIEPDLHEDFGEENAIITEEDQEPLDRLNLDKYMNYAKINFQDRNSQPDNNTIISVQQSPNSDLGSTNHFEGKGLNPATSQIAIGK
mmetsp:Transcript_40448/g.38935  ORF Transcript_40448/g.38935 Transcript_40448/m.38935 type:complete len:112 (+) Transcript_40448:316-651(+)